MIKQKMAEICLKCLEVAVHGSNFGTARLLPFNGNLLLLEIKCSVHNLLKFCSNISCNFEIHTKTKNEIFKVLLPLFASRSQQCCDQGSLPSVSWLPCNQGTILVPLGSASSERRRTVKDPPAADCHRYCSSSLCLVYTSTLSATSNGSQVVDKVGLGHTNASVQNGKGIIIFVWNKFNFQVFAAVQLGGKLLRHSGIFHRTREESILDTLKGKLSTKNEPLDFSAHSYY
ncbi:hypothetical protein P5673_008279 [Acropora cervicornis]|uniref:Uncharacterized protein n=1 Tax=Acropora cervicornis TaxID=6130 RepID=A0AAD9QU68_ACRCE|nr:hypothetical protein P5673_008279 [Acropora cervicornis]